MAAHDRKTPFPMGLPLTAEAHEAALATIREAVAHKAEADQLRRALESAAADLAVAHQAAALILTTRPERAHEIVDELALGLAVAHRIALRALETIQLPVLPRSGIIVPFHGRRP